MGVRIVFMGSPDFAVPTLRKLAGQYHLVGVVTQPDRPAGRGKVLTPPPVKLIAQEYGIPVIQPERLRQPEAIAVLQSWQPDLIVVTAFGKILRQNVLDMPPFGCVNVHASLLPRWRGAAPVQAALLHGDMKTGVTIMKMDAGVDTGPILEQTEVEIAFNDTGGSLSHRLAGIGADLLLEVLPIYLEGKLQFRLQDNNLATYAPMLKKEDGQLDFSLPVVFLANKVRAYNPWPGAFTWWKNEIFKIHLSHTVNGEIPIPGRHAIISGFPAIAALDGWLILDELQPAGKKEMPGDVFLHGARDWMNS